MNGFVFFVSLFLLPFLVIANLAVFLNQSAILGFIFLVALIAYYFWLFKDKSNNTKTFENISPTPVKSSDLSKQPLGLIHYGLILITVLVIGVTISGYISIRSVTNNIGNLSEIRGKVSDFNCSDRGNGFRRKRSTSVYIKLFGKDFNKAFYTTSSLLGKGQPCGYMSILLSINNDVRMLVYKQKIIELSIGEKVIYSYLDWKEYNVKELYSLTAISCFLMLYLLANWLARNNFLERSGVNNTSESKILAKNIGEIGGALSYWAALLLPIKSYEQTIETSCAAELANYVKTVLMNIGSEVPELPSDNIKRFNALVGSGSKNMNPSILYVTLDNSPNQCRLIVKCVAKEGLINQNSARKTVDRFIKNLKELMPIC